VGQSVPARPNTDERHSGAGSSQNSRA